MALLDVYQSRLFYHTTGQTFITTFHFEETQEDTGPFPAAGINGAFQSGIGVAVKDILGADAVLGCVKTRRIIGGVGPTDVGYFSESLGNRPGESLPGNLGIRVRLYGQLGDRPNQGGLVFSGVSEDDYANTVLTNAFIAGPGAALLTALQANLVGGAPSTGIWRFGYMSRAPFTLPGATLPWPGNFIRPQTFALPTIAQILRSRQTTRTAARLA